MIVNSFARPRAALRGALSLSLILPLSILTACAQGGAGRTQQTNAQPSPSPATATNGKATGGYDDFLTGWMLGEDKKEVWGHPVGLLVMPDGSMLITDDGANKIRRVTYRTSQGTNK